MLLLWIVLIVSLAAHGWWLFWVWLPLQRLTGQAQSLANGDFEAVTQPVGGVNQIEVVRGAMEAMAGHVQRAQADGRRYTEALTDGQEQERARLARELHDDTVQGVIAIKQGVEMALGWFTDNPTAARTALDNARSAAVAVVDGLRRLIGDLRPPALDELGLIPALEMMANRFPDFSVAITVNGTPRRINQHHALVIFRGVQEALSNTARHSNVNAADVTVNFELDGVRVTVRDRGQGFDKNIVVAEGHYGLRGIQERMASVGGSLTIDSVSGQGTRIILWIPEPSPANDCVIDPVCHTELAPNTAYGQVNHNGETYYFCCPVCMGAFQKEPQAYLNQS